MFKGLHSLVNKKPATGETSPQFQPILTADKLLDHPRRKQLLVKLPQQMSLSKENYQNLAKSLIDRFAEFVQLLPDTRNSYFAQYGGMLDHSLERTSAALGVLRGYFLPDNSEEAQLTQPQTLWCYTIFSASILSGIGKVVTDYIIELYDNHGKYLKNWSPFDGSMIHQGTQFDYDFTNVHPDPFKRRTTILLARQLMPEEGFRWIASDLDVLSVWLALLDDDQRGAGTLGPILWKADAQVINHDLNQQKIARSFNIDKELIPEPTPSKSAPADAPSIIEKDTKPGEATVAGVEMLRWIHKGLVSQRLMLNEPPLFTVPGGVMLHQDIFKYFVREHPQYKSAKAVEQSFLQLQHHMVEGKGSALQEFINTKTQATVKGYVVQNLNVVLPDQFKVAVGGNRQNAKLFTVENLTKSTDIARLYAKVNAVNAEAEAKFITPDGKMVVDPKAAIQAHDAHGPSRKR